MKNVFVLSDDQGEVLVVCVTMKDIKSFLKEEQIPKEVSEDFKIEKVSFYKN